jgi:hypothetical protein
MTTAQRTAIATPAAGLLVYDTNTNSYWYYNGAAWGNLSSSGTLSWLLTGNSGTNPSTNFIGTTDAQPLRFRVNNIWAGEMHPTNGNIFFGIHAGLSNTTGYSNTGFGDSALKLNSLGYENTAIGIQALKNNTTASRNTAIGTNALFTQSYSNNGNSWETGNVAIGYNALYLNQPIDSLFGIRNTAVGTYALQSNLYGRENTAIGYGALVSNSVGIGNTAVGFSSLFANTSGSENTALGWKALSFNNTGYSNTAQGVNALSFNTTGNENTAQGANALSFNTTGNENTAIGFYALTRNTTAGRNTAIGSKALYTQSRNNGGVNWNSNNVAVGYSALYLNQPTDFNGGIANTAVGSEALSGNTSGSFNIALGYTALVSNSNGTGNIACGVSTLYSNTDGNGNIGVGNLALRRNTNGYQNTAIGSSSLENNVGGYFNVAIGSGSGTYTSIPNATNTIGIGNNSILINNTNYAIFGNLSTAYNGGNQTWSSFSDARMKRNIKEEVKGLDFILRLRPVTYFRDIEAAMKITGNKDTRDFPEKYDVEKIKESGFLAQEVERAAKDAGYTFSGVGIPKKSNDLYTLSYEQFVVPLVKAVQEQQTMIKNQQQQIDVLLKRIEALEKK